MNWLYPAPELAFPRQPPVEIIDDIGFVPQNFRAREISPSDTTIDASTVAALPNRATTDICTLHASNIYV
jgi:hypothetical protein